MDVLAVIKTDHNTIREKLVGFKDAGGAKLRRAAFDEFSKSMQMNLTLERDYLYPELLGLFGGAEALVDSVTAHSIVVEKKLKSVERVVSKPVAQQVNIGKKIDDLESSIVTYLDAVEEALMPKIRAFIRTEEREDLAEVFSDIKEQLEEGPTGGVGAVKGRNQKRKRA